MSHFHLGSIPGLCQAAPGESRTVKAAGLVLHQHHHHTESGMTSSLWWNRNWPEAEKQETFPGWELTVDSEGTFTQCCAKPNLAGLHIKQDPRTEMGFCTSAGLTFTSQPEHSETCLPPHKCLCHPSPHPCSSCPTSSSSYSPPFFC